MRAAVLPAFHSPYDIHPDYPRPESPTGHDILIRVQAASYCHTDHVYALGEMPHNPAPPLIPCHEFAGTVEELGPSVSISLGLTRGTRVGVPGRAFHPCGVCDECMSAHLFGDTPGYGVFCPNAQNLGLSTNGGMAEFVLADSRQVAPLPDGMMAVQAAPLICAGLTVWAALARASAATQRQQRPLKVAIMGAGGGLGHLAVQFAVKSGWEMIVAVEAADRPLALLAEVVATLDGDEAKNITVVDARAEGADTFLQNLWPTGPVGSRRYERGVDAVLILPESQRAYDYGVSLLRNHGTAIVVSFPKNGFTVSTDDIVFRDISVVGSLVGRNWQLREMLHFAQSHGVRAKLCTWPLEKLNDLVQAYLEGVGGKLVVDMEQ